MQTSGQIDLGVKITLNIEKRYISWVGTREQLVQENIIPETINWPEEGQAVKWNVDQTLYKLRMKKGAAKHQWLLTSWYLGGNNRLHRIALRQREIKELTMPYGKDWDAYFARRIAANVDAPFQIFKHNLLGHSKRGRKPAQAREGQQ